MHIKNTQQFAFVGLPIKIGVYINLDSLEEIEIVSEILTAEEKNCGYILHRQDSVHPPPADEQNCKITAPRFGVRLNPCAETAGASVGFEK
jgi:hypothetical protein